MQPYTEIDADQKIKQTDKLSSLSYGNLSEVYGKNNPEQIDPSVLSKLAQQPDITKVECLKSEYHMLKWPND